MVKVFFFYYELKFGGKQVKIEQVFARKEFITKIRRKQGGAGKL